MPTENTSRESVPSGGPDPDAFAFVTELASELSWGKIDLPGIPDVAMRVRKALEDEEVAVCRRLGLRLTDYETLIRESRDEVNALRDALDS